jgi:ADP-heptose:LPS heptosyltransferase
MRILALQLKRIGDLVLTTPALAAIKAAHPRSHIALAVHSSTAGLLPAIAEIGSAVVFGPGRGWTPWQQALTGRFDVVLDFTGTDRSALAACMSRAPRRVTFDWVKKKPFRRFVYSEFVVSSVRERHTVDHYLDLAAVLGAGEHHGSPVLKPPPLAGVPETPASATSDPYAVLHPGTARADKLWLPERWVEVAHHVAKKHQMRPVFTSGPDPAERAQVAEIISNLDPATDATSFCPPDLWAFAALVKTAQLVISCDTAVVHMASAFETPQVALFGPTNPFHWRPRHPRAAVISAAHPEAPLTTFDPRMKGAPMDRIHTDVVCRSIDALLGAKP